MERLEKVRIGGIDQRVSVRGADRGNPVLLHIHGGPGYVSMAMSWWFSRGWEEFFTVVQWDQRAAGKTYLLTDPEKVAPTLTPERMIADAEQMALWARKQLGTDKIFVLGHSWGSFLGLQLAQRHPEWLFAYLLGRYDRNVNAEVAAAWFETVQAPEKHLVWFEHSGHIPVTEEPGKFLMSLVRYARTIAEKAGDKALEVDQG
jgi:pimeloyl-ACP methyl ester carboxylesterase